MVFTMFRSGSNTKIKENKIKKVALKIFHGK